MGRAARAVLMPNCLYLPPVSQIWINCMTYRSSNQRCAHLRLRTWRHRLIVRWRWLGWKEKFFRPLRLFWEVHLILRGRWVRGKRNEWRWWEDREMFGWNIFGSWEMGTLCKSRTITVTYWWRFVRLDKLTLCINITTLISQIDWISSIIFLFNALVDLRLN